MGNTLIMHHVCINTRAPRAYAGICACCGSHPKSNRARRGCEPDPTHSHFVMLSFFISQGREVHAVTQQTSSMENLVVDR
jgi:hypothetical protein